MDDPWREEMKVPESVANMIMQLVSTCGIHDMWEEPPRRARRHEPAFNPLLRSTFGGVESRYPAGCFTAAGGSPGSCDAVFEWNGDKWWIEVKFAWTYTYQVREWERNKAFRKYLFSDSPSEHSAQNDVARKLNSLIGGTAADRLGFLLVCFDSEQNPLALADIEELAKKAGLATWTKHEVAPWQNPNNPRCTIRAFFWERAAL